MLTYQEQIELRDKLANNDIEIEDAKEIYWKDSKEGNRSWQTKDWKVRRAKVIKDKCEICNCNESLTLQHFSHPKKYYDYENFVSREYVKIHIDTNTNVDKKEFSMHVINNFIYQPVPLCPKCENRKPNKRIRNVPKYLCTKCHLEFDEPKYRSIDELLDTFFKSDEPIEVRDKCFESKDKWRNQNNLSQIKYWFQREKATKKDSRIIAKEAFMLYLDDNIKYLSFEDTITACKRCAAHYDLDQMELCPKCRKFYKGVQYPTCIQCLPEDRRKMALVKIEFGKGWRNMEKELGID